MLPKYDTLVKSVTNSCGSDAHIQAILMIKPVKQETKKNFFSLEIFSFLLVPSLYSNDVWLQRQRFWIANGMVHDACQMYPGANVHIYI